jgi:hypothetical protein
MIKVKGKSRWKNGKKKSVTWNPPIKNQIKIDRVGANDSRTD